MSPNADVKRRNSNAPALQFRHQKEDDGPVVSHVSDGAPTELELMNDDYALAILTALGSGPRRGRDLIDTCGGCRSTVYRRLNQLVEAGFVRTETT